MDEKGKSLQTGITHGKKRGGKWKQQPILLSQTPKSPQAVTIATKLKDLAPWKESYDKPKRHMYPNVHRSTVYNSQDMETTQMSISR